MVPEGSELPGKRCTGITRAKSSRVAERLIVGCGENAVESYPYRRYQNENQPNIFETVARVLTGFFPSPSCSPGPVGANEFPAMINLDICDAET